MNIPISRVLTLILLLSIPLAACVSSSTRLYKGEMELINVSGDACTEEEKANRHIPLELVLEMNSSSGNQKIAGFFSGSEIQAGQLSGNNLNHLQVIYPDETGSVAKGHTLLLSPTADGMNGELNEKPQGTTLGCYFEKAALTLKQGASDREAQAALDHNQKLFSAEEHYIRGQEQLKAHNPEGALANFKESLRLRNEVDPNDPARAYLFISTAFAHVIAGREDEALAVFGNMLKEKPKTDRDFLKQQIAISGGLCNFAAESSDDGLQNAAEHFMDDVARKFGALDNVGTVLAGCYRELGRESIDQDEPDQSIAYFRKALALNPNDTDSIAGVVIGNIERDTPAEGRKFLREHAQIVIDRSGRDNYNAGLARLYAEESRQAEKGKDYTRSEQLLREALTIIPGERWLTIYLADVLEKLERPSEARKLLDDARQWCRDEACRVEFTEAIARQDRIESIVKRLNLNTKSETPEK
jgi:tetratricopeptide (TPR) repeat protein